jgi:hypothetical protein
MGSICVPHLPPNMIYQQGKEKDEEKEEGNTSCQLKFPVVIK